MLTPDVRAFVSITFRDREGNERKTSLSFPFALSDALILAYMQIWTAHVLPLTNAAIVSFTVTRGLEDHDFVRPAGGSRVLDRLALYYSNGDIFDRLIIPSARVQLLEQIGAYAGVRLDAQRPEVAAIIENMQAVIDFITTPEGDAFPSAFVVGGLML